MPSNPEILQDDFSLGIVRDRAPHLIPENGLLDAVNYLLEPDGGLFRRGGTAYKSNAAHGSAGLTFLWDGYLDPGQRTVFANSADFAVLGSNDADRVNLGSDGLPHPKQAVVAVSEVSAAFPSSLLFIGGGYIYGGSRKTAAYSTSGGNTNATNGSRTVTDADGGFTANVDAGMLFQRAATERVYVVASVDSDTSLTLSEPYQGATTTTANVTFHTVYAIAAGDPYVDAESYCVAGGRLLALTARGDVRYSATGNPHSFATNDRHPVPEGVQGLGIVSAGQNVLIFTTGGVFVFQGVAFDTVDADGNPNHRILPLSRDLVLWGGPAGIAQWENYLIVPCTNGIYLLDGVSSPVRISRSIEPLYQGYVNAAYRTGGAVVHREHYLLPILRSSSNEVFELLVCRMDRATSDDEGRSIFPWTRLGDSGALLTALAVRVGAALQQPQLLGAQQIAASRVVDCTYFFAPDAAHKADADGVAHQAHWVTRDFETGNLTINAVKAIRVWASLEDAGSDNPSMPIFYGEGQSASGAKWDQVLWDNFLWAAEGGEAFIDLACAVPEGNGVTPKRCRVGKKRRHIRFKGVTSGPAASVQLRAIGVVVHPSEALRR